MNKIVVDGKRRRKNASDDNIIVVRNSRVYSMLLHQLDRLKCFVAIHGAKAVSRCEASCRYCFTLASDHQMILCSMKLLVARRSHLDKGCLPLIFFVRQEDHIRK